MVSRIEEVNICRYCSNHASHRIFKKVRYGKNDKKTYHNVCNNMICYIQYPNDDLVKLRSLHAYNYKYQNLVLSYMIRYTSYNDHLLPSIALYIYENTVLYDDTCLAYKIIKNYEVYVKNSNIIITWIQDIISQYQNCIKVELCYNNIYSTLYDIIIGYL
jgi:hypothetical protein